MSFATSITVNVDAVTEVTIANATGEALFELGKNLFAAVFRLRRHVDRAQAALDDAHNAPRSIQDAVGAEVAAAHERMERLVPLAIKATEKFEAEAVEHFGLHRLRPAIDLMSCDEWDIISNAASVFDVDYPSFANSESESRAVDTDATNASFDLLSFDEDSDADTISADSDAARPAILRPSASFPVGFDGPAPTPWDRPARIQSAAAASSSSTARPAAVQSIMADNEVILDKDVRHIAGVRLVPSLRGPWEVYYEVVFVDGRIQQRPLSACACPVAIATFEGRYFASAHRNGQPGSRLMQPDDEAVKSESIDGSSSHDDGPEADDRHLDYIPSDDSAWDDIVDSQGRSAKSPTVRAGIRAKMSARDETFRSPSKDSGDATEDGSPTKSSTTTAEPHSATKSIGSATSDSLLQDIAAQGACGNTSPSSKRPIRGAAARGVALRRYAARCQLYFSDEDVFADDDESDGTGFSPGKKLAKLAVKDEVVHDVEVQDNDADPWGGVPAPDPWTQPMPAERAANIKQNDGWHFYRTVSSYLAEKAQPLPLPKRSKTQPDIGVVGNLFAEYFASQERNKGVSSSDKVVKTECISDDDANKSSVIGKKRKRPRPRDSPSMKAIDVIYLSDDEDYVPRVPAKKSKKRELDSVVYVLSSDSDELDPPKP